MRSSSRTNRRLRSPLGGALAAAGVAAVLFAGACGDEPTTGTSARTGGAGSGGSSGDGPGRDGGATGGGESQDVVVVDVKSSSFDPAEVTVEPGTEVRWDFVDKRLAHNVYAEEFKSPFRKAGSFTHRFDEPGTYAYRCTLHPQMRATVVVK